jgi:predicted glycosyltransferase
MAKHFNKKILVAPLNWGLGHATRCMPVIKMLIQQGFEPIIASDGDALLLLQKEFPHLKSFELPCYNITYPKNSKMLIGHLALRGRHFIKIYKAEQKTVSDIVKKEAIQGIISDNRFGCFHPDVKSVYITHQINVLSGVLTYFTSKMHQKVIKKYDACWVPDEEKSIFSGRLSKNKLTSTNIRFIGILSRFKPQESPVKYNYLLLLSGPEPQRSRFEKILLKAFKNTSKKVLLIQGKVSQKQKEFCQNGIRIINYVTQTDLQKFIAQSEIIISRSGYSTIMDLAVMGKKAFFIPTPGQTEQMYLAQRLKEKQIAPFSKQEKFKIEHLTQLSNFTGFTFTKNSDSRLKQALLIFK